MSNPTTHVEQFNESLGGLSGVQPIRYNDGLWLVSEAHNQWGTTSGTVETGIGSWGDFGSSAGVTVVWTQSSDWAAGGTKSLKCVMTCDDANADQSSRQASIAGLMESTSYCIRAVANRLTPEIRLRLNAQWRSDGGDIGSEVSVADIASGTAAGVTDIAAVLTSPAGTTNARLIWRMTLSQVGVAHTAYMDNHAIIPSAWIDEYFDGSSGDGFSWDGTAFASASTRAASSASISPTGILGPASGAIACRVTPTIETGLEEVWGECGMKGAGTDHLRWGRDASKHPFVEWSSDDGSYQRLTSVETADAGIEHFVLIGHNGTDVFIKAAGGARESGTRDAVEGSFGAGDLVLKASVGGNVVGPLATFNRMLTDAEIYTVEHTEHWSMGMLGNEMVRRIRAQFELRPAY